MIRKNRESNIGLQAGENHPLVILTYDQVEEIKIFGYIFHLKQKDIAKKFGVHKSCINHILLGNNWNPDHLSKAELIHQTKKRYKTSKKSFTS